MRRLATALRCCATQTMIALAAPCLLGCHHVPRGQWIDLRQLDEVEFAQFDRADSDRDGRLSPAEAQAALPDYAAHFAQVDTDDSGYLSWNEIKAAHYGGGLAPLPPIRR